ncbi:MAG: hypothetical protein HWN80_18805 [Candidatus Lokiarchaeota archaeon]|nr:hypothetical protein [Candidatus Lokiarchaeota archaeon]
MGKGGSILGIIGILLGAGGLGFGFIAWNNQNTMQANLTVQNIWYQYDGDLFDANPAYTYLHIPNMSIVFDLTTTASIHILFTCSVGVTADPTDFEGLSFYFSIDGIRLTQPRVDVGPYEGSSTVDYYSVALQHFIPSFSSGTHNISSMVFSEDDTHFLRFCSLTIQSFTV